MNWLIIVGVIALLLVLYVVGTYNNLVVARNKVKNQWSQIQVLLKRRYDLIPNLVETVKGYAKHEKGTFEDVVKARNLALGAKTTEEEIKAAGAVTEALGRLFALSESYPELKANESFLELQSNLRETEDKISYSRQFYNDSVLSYNNKIEVFPSNLVAKLFSFKPEAFFEASEEEKKNVQVKF